MPSHLEDIYKVLQDYLDPEMSSLMQALSTDSLRSEYTRLPDESNMTLSPVEVSRWIALSSNKYSDACRLASLARARARAAERAFKFKFKSSLGDGKNEHEREANATRNSEQEHAELVLAEIFVDICEGIESANRIASESARRMLLASEQVQRAETRFGDHASSLRSSDFNGY